MLASCLGQLASLNKCQHFSLSRCVCFEPDSLLDQYAIMQISHIDIGVMFGPVPRSVNTLVFDDVLHVSQNCHLLGNPFAGETLVG